MSGVETSLADRWLQMSIIISKLYSQTEPLKNEHGQPKYSIELDTAFRCPFLGLLLGGFASLLSFLIELLLKVPNNIKQVYQDHL